MAFNLSNLLGSLGKKGNAGAPTALGAGGSMPIIGHLPISQQNRVLSTGIGACLAIAALFVYLNGSRASEYSTRVSIATEMKMLSQRLARTASQTLLGNETAFNQLDEGYKAYGDALNRLQNGGGGLSQAPAAFVEPLKEIKTNWDNSFGRSVQFIKDQKTTLVTINRSVNSINQRDAQLLDLSQQLIGLLSQINANSRELGLANQQVMLTQRMAKNANAMLAGETIDPEVVFMLGKDTNSYKEAIEAFSKGSEELRIAASSNSEVKAKLDEISKVFKDYETSVSVFSQNMQSLVKAKQAGRQIFEDSETILKKLSVLTDDFASKSTGPITYFYYLMIVLAVALALLFLVGLGLASKADAERRSRESELENKRNQEAILRLLNEMGDLADGDLTVRASVTEDLTGAIADSMNYTIEELRNLISEINRATEHVTAATQQAQAISNQLLEAAQRQSQEIQDTSQSVLQMASSINDVSQTAANSALVADQSLSAAAKGRDAVENQIRGMNEIRDQIQETAKRIKRLGESSQEIGEIVELISDITEQTNVLALNAAIQAASAGDAGRGFTVVAEEVQRLAERSAEATKQIGAIVKTIQTDTQDAVAAMESSTQGVVEGTKLSDAAGQALSEIGSVSRQLAELISSISNATQSQSEMASRVSRSMQDILGVTEQTYAGTKQTAVSVGQLASLAAELKGSVSGFKIN